MCEKGLTQQWKNTGVLTTSFSIKDPKKGQEDKDDPRNAIQPVNLAEGFDFDAWRAQSLKKTKSDTNPNKEHLLNDRDIVSKC